jgi:hypothetical protein
MRCLAAKKRESLPYAREPPTSVASCISAISQPANLMPVKASPTAVRLQKSVPGFVLTAFPRPLKRSRIQTCLQVWHRSSTLSSSRLARANGDALKFQTSAREWLGALFQIAKAPRRSLTRRRNSESDSAATMPPGQTPFQILFMSPIISGTGTMTGLASKGHGLRTGELVVPRRWQRGHTNPCRTSPCRWSHGRAAKDDERSRRHSRPT